MEELKQYMEQTFNETKLGVLSQIEGYLNYDVYEPQRFISPEKKLKNR